MGGRHKEQKALNNHNYYLSPEMTLEVLIRLPVKSLLRFRCVSKYWHSLISSTYFINLHLNRNINNQNNILERNLKILTVESVDTTSPYLSIRMGTDFKQCKLLMELPSSYHPLVSNDSLVLLLNCSHKPTELVLINPSIKKSTSLPNCPLLCGYEGAYAMGIAPASNDFKVAVFGRYSSSKDGVPLFAVYSVKHGCWTTKHMDSRIDFYSIQRKHVFTRGQAHWLNKKQVINGYDNVVSFDFDEERFKFIRLPDSVFPFVGLHVDLFSLRGSVAILSVSPSSFCIWVRGKDEDDSESKTWAKMYSGDSSSHTHIIIQSFNFNRKFWFVETGFLYSHADGMLWSYDIRGAEPKINKIQLSHCSRSIRHVDTYVESFLLC